GTGSATLVLTVAQTYTLSITASPSAGGTFTGAGIYAPGTVVSISETAASGYRLNGWGGSGVAAVASASSASTTVTMNANCSLTAQFVQQGVVTVTATAGGSATGGGTFDVGTAAPLAATASSGYVFTGWTGSSDVANANSAATTVNVTGAENLVANFVAAANPEQLGTIVFPNAVPPGLPGVNATTSSMNAVVTNSGTSTVTITNVTTSGNFTPTVSLPITLAPGASQSIPVTFAPQVLGLQTGLLTGVSSDPSNPVFQFVLEGTGVNPSSPPSATITAAATAYTGSPFYVSSTAFAPNNNLTQHSIEWMSPEGVWNVDTLNVSGGNSSRTLGITFTETGTWTLRAGASVDNGQTWYYSPSVTVSVSSGTSSYTFESMSVPSGTGSQIWYSASPVVQQTYQVQHTNPTTPGQ
ncbi:MAG TPA: hypothetical protein VFE31_10240, partial [Opitutaceae bacterium]|nr:hypothetical protein [Opitutaceae bacterium]